MEHQIYLEAIKKALKSKGITYADLATSLRMTESGVKKMLNAKDISFQRILKICKVIDVLPGQLFSLSEKSSIPTLILSDKQQDALIKDRRLLAVYWLFTIEKRTPDEIATIQLLKPQELKVALQKLVTLDLISQKKNLFAPKHHGKFRWPDDSKIARLLNQEWSRLVLNRSLKSSEKDQALHRLSALKISKQSYGNLIKKFFEVLDEAVQTSEREEMTLPKNDLTDVAVLLAIVQGGFFTAD